MHSFRRGTIFASLSCAAATSLFILRCCTVLREAAEPSNQRVAVAVRSEGSCGGQYQVDGPA